MNYYLLGLGSNIDPESNLNSALELLALQGELVDVSPAITTTPVGNTFQHFFMNQLVILKSEQQANFLKFKLQNIERQLGREEKTPLRKDKDRTIDIDILYKASDCQDCLTARLEDSYNQHVQEIWLQQQATQLVNT